MIDNPNVPVVLVPGFRDNERKVAYLARRLRARGFAPHAVSPQPSDGSAGLDALAAQLAAAIETRLGSQTRFHLFGFSMGGLIGRYYIQKLAGAPRVEKFVTLATPNRGSWMSRIYPHLPACVQMRPDSTFLADLNRDLSTLDQVDYTSIWSSLDLTVVPATSSRLPVGTMMPLVSPVHGWLLRDARVVDTVVTQFAGAEQARASGHEGIE